MLNADDAEAQAALNVVLEDNMYLGQVIFYALDRLFLQWHHEISDACIVIMPASSVVDAEVRLPLLLRFSDEEPLCPSCCVPLPAAALPTDSPGPRLRRGALGSLSRAAIDEPLRWPGIPAALPRPARCLSAGCVRRRSALQNGEEAVQMTSEMHPWCLSTML